MRLPKRQRLAVFVTIGWVATSGIAWLVAHEWLARPGDFGPEEHPLARWSLVAHGVGAYGLLVVAGSLWTVHMRSGWRERTNRFSGAAMAGTLTLLAGSGLWLYYGGGDGREWISAAHWIVGLLLVPLLLWHRRRGRPARFAARPREPASMLGDGSIETYPH